MTDTVNVPRLWLEEVAGYLGATDKNDWSDLKSDDAIRGSHCIRVGALVDLRAMLAAVPKAEQEPWDHAVRYRDYGWGYASELPADQRELVLHGIPFWEVKPLYTHPAPASDELLAALEKSYQGWSNAIELSLLPPQHVATAEAMRDELWHVLAKHKGPQS